MSPPPPPEEIARLMRFIAEQSKGVKSPMSIRWLATQFKEKTGSPISVNGLCNRILSNRERIHKMRQFDMDTKVEMIFALSARIEKGFLNELRKHAEVDVDKVQRIIRFKKTGGGLELNGRHNLTTVQKDKRDREMLQFLVEKSKTVMTPFIDMVFVKEYKARSGDISTPNTLVQIYNRLKRTIFELPGIDKNTKVKMMYISYAMLSDEILEKLRIDAYVEVDIKGRIEQYEAHDGSLKLGTKRCRYTIIKATNADITRQSLGAISRGTKRAREESTQIEYNTAVDFDPYSAGRYEYLDYDSPSDEKRINHALVEKKSELLREVKTETPSTSNGGYHYEENFFDYNPPRYEKDKTHIPVDEKPESLIGAKLEELVEPSTSNFEY